MDGVIRTYVGYAGGTKKNPSYYSLGDHTETIRVYYDPKKVSYEQLLDIFWAEHDPTARPWSKQYKSAIFYHSEEQKRLALATAGAIEEKTKRKVYTEIVPALDFYPAEDYHQKYYLRNSAELMKILKEVYRSDDDFVASTAAARMNGHVAGFRPRTGLDKTLREAGLSPSFTQRILSAAQSSGR
jgi:peptide-methionine (S)-S-oxide reductase